MFKTLEKSLDRPLSDLELKKFKHTILNNVDIVKVHIDPVTKKRLTAYFVFNKNEEVIKNQLNSFLNKWNEDLSKKENSKNNVNLINVNEPPIQKLNSCCSNSNNSNISNELLEKKWITILKGRDIGYTEEIVSLLNFFDKSYQDLVISEMSDSHKINKVGFSSLIPKYYMEKLGYFSNSPEHLFFASHLSLDSIEKFTEESKTLGGHLPQEEVFFESPEYVLQSAPCFKVYFSLEDEILNENKIFNLKGHCFRNEIKNTYLLERLLNFTQREFVFIGSPEFVVEGRDKSLELTIEWMRKMGISGRCELANDPFFINDDQKQKFNIPSKIKYEVRADIPYKDDSISIASFDTHGDFFSRTFNFKLDNSENTWSGCIGLGIERCVWSFLQQYGLDKEKWPTYVRQNYNK